MKVNILKLILFCFSGGRSWLGWGVGFGHAFFFDTHSSSSSSTTNNTQNTTSTETIGADNGAISASNSTVNILDGGAIGGAFDLGKNALKANQNSMYESLRFGRDAISSNEKALDKSFRFSSGTVSDSLKFGASILDKAFRANDSAVKDSIGISTQAISKAYEREGDTATKWIIGGVVAVAITFAVKGFK